MAPARTDVQESLTINPGLENSLGQLLPSRDSRNRQQYPHKLPNIDRQQWAMNGPRHVCDLQPTERGTSVSLYIVSVLS